MALAEQNEAEALAKLVAAQNGLAAILEIQLNSFRLDAFSSHNDEFNKKRNKARDAASATVLLALDSYLDAVKASNHFWF